MTKYAILCQGRKIYKDLTESDYFSIMDELSEQYFRTGSPKPEDLETEFMEDTLWQ
jgi:hypothetical protein